MKVLIIEDDIIIRFILSHHFTSAGFDIILTEDGEDGMKNYRLCKNDINLIITDLMMPKLDGYAVAKTIRYDIGDTIVPIIAITASVTNKKDTHLFNYVLQKPLDIGSLLSLSESLIMNSQKNNN